MAGLLTHLLEGNILSEFDKLSRDGDPKHLGTIGHNLTLISMTQRADAIRDAGHAEAAAAQAELARQGAIDDANIQAAHMERVNADRDEAIRLAGLKRLPKSERVKALPDSDEGVEDFLKNLY